MDFGVGVNRLYIVLRKVREYFFIHRGTSQSASKVFEQRAVFIITPTSVNRDPIASPAAP